MTAIRASSLPELFDCPARWEAKHLCGRRLPRSAAAQLGTAVHAGAAVFDVQRILGSPITPDDAAGEVVDAIHHPKEDVDWGEDSPREAERIALALHGLYCRNIAPGRSYVAVEATCERLEITDLGLALNRHHGPHHHQRAGQPGHCRHQDRQDGGRGGRYGPHGRPCRPDRCL
ncbi:PD-(D/E)XK nuclease family protein [Desulfovibrio piger]